MQYLLPREKEKKERKKERTNERKKERKKERTAEWNKSLRTNKQVGQVKVIGYDTTYTVLNLTSQDFQIEENSMQKT